MSYHADKLQAQNWVKSDFEDKSDPEGQGRSPHKTIYRKTSNIRRTLVGNKIVDHSDVFGASPVGTAPATSSYST